jgi:micrococcal nuclease
MRNRYKTLKPTVSLALCFALYLVSAAYCAGDRSRFSGVVVGISDGDTITVLTNEKQQIRVRLDGIDCPELHQAYGTKAKQYTSVLVYNKAVTILTHGKDRYGRTIGTVLFSNGNLNEELVKTGLAWAYAHYSTQFLPLEKSARAKKIGLWGDAHPTPPWDFRQQRSKKLVSSLDNPSYERNQTGSASTVFITPNGSKYHRSECKSLHSQGQPISKTEAAKRGLLPCKVCKP